MLDLLDQLGSVEMYLDNEYYQFVCITVVSDNMKNISLKDIFRLFSLKKDFV